MHSGLELYLDGKDHKQYVETKEEEVQFDCIKNHLDNHLQETWYQEIPLYSNQLGVAGRVDLIGLYNNMPTIIDFKTSRKLKKKQWISKIYFPFYRLFSIVTLSFLYRPLVYNFLDNKFGKRVSLYFSLNSGHIRLIEPLFSSCINI